MPCCCTGFVCVSSYVIDPRLDLFLRFGADVLLIGERGVVGDDVDVVKCRRRFPPFLSLGFTLFDSVSFLVFVDCFACFFWPLVIFLCVRLIILTRCVWDSPNDGSAGPGLVLYLVAVNVAQAIILHLYLNKVSQTPDSSAEGAGGSL